MENFRLIDLAYSDEPLRAAPPNWSLKLPVNPVPEPDPTNVRGHEVTFTGGMMGGLAMREMGITGEGHTMRGDDRMGMMQGDDIWFVNGVAATGHVLNPIHMHGHSFRVLSRNGQPTMHREWQDTVLMSPRERVEIVFVADNSGDWMFHCHILEHQAVE